MPFSFSNSGGHDNDLQSIVHLPYDVAMPPMTIRQAFEMAQQLQRAGRMDEAQSLYRQILQFDLRHADAMQMLGIVACEQGRQAEGIDWMRRAIQINPDEPAYHANFGLALSRAGDFDQAIEQFQQAVRLRPGPAVVLNNYGNLLRTVGRLDEALAVYQQAASIAEESADESNLLWFSNFHPALSPQEILDLHVRWDRKWARPLLPEHPVFANDRSPDRRLRIGYVSPDFHEHPVARFLAPVMQNHDHRSFEIFCFSDVVRADACTARIRGYTDVWRDVAHLTDEQLASVIRQDRIDILIDLAAHSSGSRLLAFARKPAPVQVTYLGYCSTTGLSTMDYRLTDPLLDAPEFDEGRYSERSMRLAHSYWCYSPPEDAPEVAPLPMQSNGHVIFGCLNNFSKVNGITLELWRELLLAVAGSRLILHCVEGSHRHRVQQSFAAAGIEPHRIELVGFLPKAQYFQQFNRVDIALDPFPYGGGTTTCDALWMGVPVVSLAGQTAVGRAGLSILSNVGLPELVARDRAQYLAIATRLANSPAVLGDWRSTLRSQMQASPLMDAPQAARDIESAFRQMWHKWCASAV